MAETQQMTSTDLQNLDTTALLRLYTGIMSELKARGVSRGMNNPIADYAESLVAQAVGATLRRPSNAGHDLVDGNGVRYEVKARRLTGNGGGRQLSALRGLDEQKFDFLVGVLFTEDMAVYRAALVPWQVVLDRATYVPHTNAWNFVLVDSVWEIPGVQTLELEGHSTALLATVPLKPDVASYPNRSRMLNEPDRTLYDLIGEQTQHLRLGKGRAMLALVSELARRGVSPEHAIARTPRTEHFMLRSADGELTAKAFRDMVVTTSGGVKRFFVNDGELIYYGGRTYALTSQWTLDLFKESISGLAGLVAQHGLELKETGTTRQYGGIS